MKNTSLYILVCLFALALTTQAAPILNGGGGPYSGPLDTLMKNFAHIEQTFKNISFGSNSTNIFIVLNYIIQKNTYYNWNKFKWDDFCEEDGYCKEDPHDCPPAIPEPASIALCSIAVLGFAGYRLRAMRK